MIKVSILVPVYGVEKFIERCARSLMEQTYQDIEYIFIDDCSPDNSIAILQSVIAEYPQRKVSIIRHEKNKGLGGSRKTALMASTGDYILNIDSDDYLEKNAVSLLVEEAMKKKADVVRMNCFFEWENSKTTYQGKWTEDAHAYTKLLLNTSTLPGVCLHFIKKRLYDDYDLCPQEGINIGEDYVLTPRLCYYANKIGQVSKPIYHYIQTNTSSYTTIFNKKKVECLKSVAEIIYGFFKDKPEFLSALNEGMWQKKVEMMLTCTYSNYTLVDTLPTWLPMSTATMNIQQKYAAPLVKHKQWKLLRLYSFAYNIAFHFIQKIKGR